MQFLKYLALSSALFYVTPAKTSETVPTSPPNFLLASSVPLTKEETLVPLPEVIDFYIDCDSKNYSGKKPVPRKNYRDIISQINKRRNFESTWTQYFNTQSKIESLSMHDIDNSSEWKFPVARENYFENNFNANRLRAGRWIEKHKAIDVRLHMITITAINDVIIDLFKFYLLWFKVINQLLQLCKCYL